MNILGISGLYHDSAAVVYVDGELISAAQEERFTRVKHDESFPINAIEFCLKRASLEIKDIDYVSFYDKPLLKFERILETHMWMAPKGLISFISSMPIWMKEKMFFRKVLKSNFKKLGKVDWRKTKILFPEHHLSHAAGAYYPSGFYDAAILTVDGVGEWTTTSICKGNENDISVLKEINFPHSLGLLYSAFTSFLGFKVNSGEYKLMGLAPYGDPNSEKTKHYISKIKSNLISIKTDGSYQLNLDYFKFTFSNKTFNNRKFQELFGFGRRKVEDELTQDYCDLAIAIQKVTEEVMLGLAKEAKRLTGSSNLCLSGGVALNCVANGVIQRSGLFENIFIQPASGDAGGALGAALAAKHIFLNDKSSSEKSFSVYSGGSYTNKEIENELIKVKAVFNKSDSIENDTALLLKKQKVIGWFQGAMEFGPRALGNRSILGDPRSSEMQKVINLKIKFREAFRPFAPAVLEEDVSEYFEFEGKSPYMLLVDKVNGVVKQNGNGISLIDRLEGKTCDFPAITHVDGSARIQTVSKNDNIKFYKLLKEVKKETGYGMVVNTSFNVRGEPIVCTPYDAYRCFMETNMDVLVIGDYLLVKENQPTWVKAKKKFKLD